MAAEFLRPTDLVGLSEKAFREYRAVLDRFRVHQLPWAGYPEQIRFWKAETAVEHEMRRRGTQLKLL